MVLPIKTSVPAPASARSLALAMLVAPSHVCPPLGWLTDGKLSLFWPWEKPWQPSVALDNYGYKDGEMKV
jgi:hypothetical protein